MRRLSLDSTELADVVISLSKVSSAIGVEYDSDTDSIYWSDLDADIIGHAFWNGSAEEVLSLLWEVFLSLHIDVMSLFGYDVWELLHISLIFNCAIKNCAVHSQKFSHVIFFVFIGYEDLNTQKVKNLFF